MKAVLIFLGGMILFISAVGRVVGWQLEAPGAPQRLNSQQILSATVMMTITTPNWQEKASTADEALPIPNDEYRTLARAEGDVVSEGLGTLIANGDDLLLVTHDHWSHFDETLGTVAFRTADGTSLGEVDLNDFKACIRSRDGGTMVVGAPSMLKTAVPIVEATLQARDLQAGDHGFVVRRLEDRVVINEVRVIAQAEKQSRPVVQLQSIDGMAITGGDSGGGVWLNGNLVAVMWTTVMMENTTTGARRATDMSVAALY